MKFVSNQHIVLLSSVILAILFVPVFGSFAYAQYMGSVGEHGETGVNTLEETLELAKRRIEAVQANPGSGSGTPYLNADGVVGAAIIAGAVFGGIAGAFFFMARKGKYAAPGRG